MKLETYEHIRDNIHLLDIDYEAGIVRNRNVQAKRNGYYYVGLKNKLITIHQIIAFMKYWKKCIGFQVNHINGIKTDNKPNNLELVTAKENIHHAWETGLCKRQLGEENRFSKLTNEQVLDIHFLLRLGMKQKYIAKRCGVERANISSINTGKTWAHIKREPAYLSQQTLFNA